MCGFAGEYLFHPGQADLHAVRRMADTLRHRGPDEDGHLLSPDGRCALAFRRLQIIDPAGSAQPMSLPDGTAVVYNGEIYNFRQLRRQLRSLGATFHTEGDTEVLLHLHQRAPHRLPADLRGMFAFALYDPHQGLLLARDPVGQKPLWYAPLPDRIVFASEAKALLAHPLVSADLCPESLCYYLTTGYIPAGLSAWQGIHKLRPANILHISTRMVAPVRYWWPQPADLPAGKPELLHIVRDRLADSVAEHLVSDVPLGALLSGGIDSAVVVALMCQAVGRTGGIRTFTARFDDPAYDEGDDASRLARHLGTDHTELHVQPDPAGMLDFVVSAYDEPFADSSALPTHLVCKAARQHVKVALTGDGGDEVFGGYDRYRALLLARTLGPARYAAIRLASLCLRPFARGDQRSRLARLHRFADALPLPSSQQYFAFRSLFSPDDLGRLLTDEFADDLALDQPRRWFLDLYEEVNPEPDDEVFYAQRCDLLTYLPDDVLCKTDIASMAASLELRPPMLATDVVETGLGLPLNARTSHRQGKMILREAFAGLLPPETLKGRKRGFGVPLARWLREDLRPQVEQTLLDASFHARNWIRPEAIAGLLNDHFSGQFDHSQRIWALMVLARWLEKESRGR
jgi:asparagine synthase (glutamine-hydrolysing)